MDHLLNKFSDKKTGSGVIINEKLAEELHKPVIKKFKRRGVFAIFKDNIWGKDLSKMRSLFFRYKNVEYLLCLIDLFTKYAWVKPLKDKKAKTDLSVFSKVVNETNHKPNKLWFIRADNA